jgi:alanine dehydrogenase
MPTRILDRDQVARCLSMNDTVAAVEAAFRAFANGEATMPPKVYLSIPEVGGDFRAMPARFGDYAGLKWVSSHPRNPGEHGLPAVIAVFILSDPRDARPLAIMDGTVLTERRTGAAAAVASRWLAHAHATVGFIGCGAQAHAILEAHRAVFGDDFQVLAYDRDPAIAAAFTARAGGRVVSLEEVSAVDILNTITPSRAPVVRADHLLAHTHVNAMGADAPGKRELSLDVLKGAAVFVDDLGQALHSGEVNVPVHDGSYAAEELAGTLGEVIAGWLARGPGRTVFDSTGLGIQDVAAAAVVYERARAEGIGLELELAVHETMETKMHV